MSELESDAGNMTATYAASTAHSKANVGECRVVVLTGGVCGGKTTVQTMLSDVFANMGWKVFRVPETASILLGYTLNFTDTIYEIDIL